MPVETRASGEKNDDINQMLKSAEFSNIISAIVKSEVSLLHKEINALRDEIKILKETNIDLIKLLTNDDSQNIKFSKKSYSKVVAGEQEKSKVISFSDNVIKTQTRPKEDKKGLSLDNKVIEKDITNSTNDWNVVTGKRRRSRNMDFVRGSDAGTCSIKGAERFSNFHVFRLEPGLHLEKLSAYLESKDVVVDACVPMVSKHPEQYSSFKITVRSKYSEKIMDPTTWPEEVCINRFLMHLSKKDQII